MKKVILFVFIILLSILTAYSIYACCQPGELKAANSTLSKDVLIGNKSSGSISKQEILQAKKLAMKSPLDSSFQVASFRMTRVRKGETPIEVKNDMNGDLNEKMLELTGTLIPGDKVYFEYIKCRSVDGTTLSFEALSFVIE